MHVDRHAIACNILSCVTAVAAALRKTGQSVESTISCLDPGSGGSQLVCTAFTVRPCCIVQAIPWSRYKLS